VERLALLDVAGILHYGEYTRELVNLRLSQHGHFMDPLRRAVRSLFTVSSRLFTDEDPRNMSIERTPAWLFIQHDFGPALRQIQAPAWIGWGKQDDVAPRRTATALQYLLRAHGLTVYLNSGHTPMQSEPQAVAEDLVNFLRHPPQRLPATDAPTGAREGVCNRERDRIFEGEYTQIRIHHCRNVILRNVRAQSIEFVHSKAALTDVDVYGSDTGATITQSQVLWTGGTVRAATCIDAASSRMNLAAVTCQFSQQGIRVRDRSKLLASVSLLQGEHEQQLLHGEYTLGRNTRP
jgi:hypothetical protein